MVCLRFFFFCRVFGGFVFCLFFAQCILPSPFITMLCTEHTLDSLQSSGWVRLLLAEVYLWVLFPASLFRLSLLVKLVSVLFFAR